MGITYDHSEMFLTDADSEEVDVDVHSETKKNGMSC